MRCTLELVVGEELRVGYTMHWNRKATTVYMCSLKYGRSQLQVLNGTRLCSCVNMCICLSHMLQHASPFVVILLLQTYGHYPLTLFFYTLSASHLRMLNGAC